MKTATIPREAVTAYERLTDLVLLRAHEKFHPTPRPHEWKPPEFPAHRGVCIRCGMTIQARAAMSRMGLTSYGHSQMRCDDPRDSYGTHTWRCLDCGNLCGATGRKDLPCKKEPVANG